MADVKEVINALEMSYKYSNVDEDNTLVPQQIVLHTIDLLKAQEPRVLTLEEAKKADVCWLEQRGYEPYVTDDADTWNPEIYGKAYRCWSAMPTEEQRKAVKWDAAD